MFKELVPFMRMKADLQPELRNPISAELPGGGDYVKIKSVSFLFRSPSPNLVSASYLKNKIQTAVLS